MIEFKIGYSNKSVSAKKQPISQTNQTSTTVLCGYPTIVNISGLTG